MKVCIGGTFDGLHKGHKLLLQKAFEIAGSNGFIFIGITTDKAVKRKNNVKSFDERKKNILNYIENNSFSIDKEVKPISDKYGPSVKGDFDAIVVSPETKKTADEINQKRKDLGKKPLKIFQIPFVLAKDKKPISSTRIRQKEIDEHGNLLG